ncbi:uncharacterized protein LOC125941584 [Dermacentor silvarum]|uniref:uncharacterized protein LOC125941584 n=1 Tax=Dermacentor silvarum TaxID=543639 RepID=UPI0021016CA6|nr:uncharacterized protein LOC125941584 [Dermacentor silvarum]
MMAVPTRPMRGRRRLASPPPHGPAGSPRFGRQVAELDVVGAENERHEIDMFLSCTHLSSKGDADLSCVITRSTMGRSLVAYYTSQASKPGVSMTLFLSTCC